MKGENMNLSVAARQLDMTDAIRTHIETSVESLKKFNLDIISTRVVVSADEKQGKKGFTVDLNLNLPQKTAVVIKQKDKDMYAAIDLATDRAMKVLRRYHDKEVGHRVEKLTEVGNLNFLEPADIEDNIEMDTDEIIPMELDSYKPMDIEEALDMIKDTNQQFLIFNDKEDKTRVLYKRKDNKFGLY
jgi:putative sigma-54 modulation protein